MLVKETPVRGEHEARSCPGYWPELVAGCPRRIGLRFTPWRSGRRCDPVVDIGVAADIELIGFSNSNRDPFLQTWTLRQTVAEWIRCVWRDLESAAALEALTRVVATSKFGAARFAHLALRAPDRILTATADHLHAAGLGEETDITETAAFARLCISLARVL